MKKKNIISLAGVVALLMGLGLNLEYALDDYGLKSNSLNLFVLAQGSTTAHCVVETTTTTVTTSGSSSSVSGGVSAGYGGVSGGVSGSTGSSSGGTTTSTVTSKKEYEATMLYCITAVDMIQVCTEYDPC